ncbi:hypothetical protein HMPREF0645_2041 [Hallella bergensis DSM 17361]|uniref:Protein BatD n=1 Tax=Hallella bergensis DSM 17361 TaxID=585502 RepID=D1PYK6_9BACT|nr:hypothetical protein [Hallella bergensis]EFA43551.1 hypothetical protein HMPREF0645_2041 [Hallella bergensis DSM 17361]
MKKNIRNALMLLFLLSTATVRAQVVVEQTVDSVGILIGEQAHLRLGVTMPKGASLQWPELKATQYVVPGVEVVSIADGDTAKADNNQVKIERTYTITSFDENLYAIPALTVKVDGKPYKGGTAALKVITMDVDTLHPNQFFPPKDVQANPFLWSEWSPWFWLSLLVLLLALLAYYLIVRLRENKPIITRIRIVKHIPPHQRALNAIDKIKAEHLQTSEDQKTYYTRLTDTLRQYIRERFGFNALEMTSSEIIERLQTMGDRRMLDELTELFNTADLVKFAKYSTLVNENDLNLVNAVNFIDSTKVEGQPTEEKIVPKLSDDDKRKQQSRKTIKGMLWALGVLILGLLAYIVYNVYLLMT